MWCIYGRGGEAVEGKGARGNANKVSLLNVLTAGPPGCGGDQNHLFLGLVPGERR